MNKPNTSYLRELPHDCHPTSARLAFSAPCNALASRTGAPIVSLNCGFDARMSSSRMGGLYWHIEKQAKALQLPALRVEILRRKIQLVCRFVRGPFRIKH